MSRYLAWFVTSCMVGIAASAAGSVFLVGVSAVPATPLPEPARPAITVNNAAQLHTIAELPLDIWRIVLGPKRGQLALLGWEKPVQVVDESSYRTLQTIAAERQLIQFAVSPDRTLAAWCENTTKAEIYDLRTGKTITLDTKQAQPGVAFSPDGKLLATSGYGTEPKLWETASGRLVHALSMDAEGGLTVVFSPDGQTIAVGNRNSSTRLFSTTTGKLIRTLPKTMSQELKFSPSGHLLAVAYVDGSLAWWEVATGNLVHECQTSAKELYTLDWSPNGDVLATAGREGKITLWDGRRFTMLRELDAPEWVIQVRFSFTGDCLFTAGGTIQRSPARKVTVWGCGQ